MTKSNHTVTIGKVLMRWLDEKGWDVGNIYVGDNEASDFANLIYFVNFERYEDDILVGFCQFEFTQSELEAATPKTPRRGGAVHITDNHLVSFIRAELERQVDCE